MLGEAVINYVAAVEQEVGPPGVSPFGALARHFRITLRVADDGKRPGSVFLGRGLKRELRAADFFTLFVGAKDAIKIARADFQVLERDLADQFWPIGLGGHFERSQL